MKNTATALYVHIVNQLAALYSWFVSNPARTRVALLTIAALVLFVLVLAPNALVAAGQASGGSNP